VYVVCTVFMFAGPDLQVSLERHGAIMACCKNILATGGEAQSILAMVRRGVAIDQVPSILHHSHAPVVSALQVLISGANLGSLLSLQLEEQLQPYGLGT
jgi:hypothetical protein